MSSRRQTVLKAIRQHFRETGCSPSYAEIGERTGLEPRHVRPHLEQLQDDGLLTYRRGVGRSIVLVDRMANLSDEEVERGVHGRGWTLVKSTLPLLADMFPIDPTLKASFGQLLKQLDEEPESGTATRKKE
jgi:DNA-binding transcriptional ArsR family regulator